MIEPIAERSRRPAQLAILALAGFASVAGAADNPLEEIVVTATGHEVITRFPAEELLVAGAPFVTVGGQLPIVREIEAPPNAEVAKMVAAAAKAEGEKVGAGSRG